MKERAGGWRRAGTLVGSVAAAVASSFCCLGPIMFAALGVGSISLQRFFWTWRPLFLAVALGMIGYSFYLSYARKSPRWQRGLLWLLGALVLLMVAYPYLSSGTGA